MKSLANEPPGLLNRGFRRSLQCKACPWKISSRLEDIPGYEAEKHRGLAGCTGATVEGLRIMACHESPQNSPYACVGWLANQIGSGNNLNLRLALTTKRIRIGNLKLDGEQFASLEEMAERK